MNIDLIMEYTLSTNHPSISNSAKYYAEKLYLEECPIMKKVYFNTLIRLLDGKLETSQSIQRVHPPDDNG